MTGFAKVFVLKNRNNIDMLDSLFTSKMRVQILMRLFCSMRAAMPTCANFR